MYTQWGLHWGKLGFGFRWYCNTVYMGLNAEPNTSSPLNTQAAALWSNQEEYRKMVQKLYKPTAA